MSVSVKIFFSERGEDIPAIAKHKVISIGQNEFYVYVIV